MIYCSLLNPALDLIYSVPEFQTGITLTDLPLEVHPAGKGISVARVIKTLGEEVSIAGIIPENDLRRYSTFLQSENIGAIVVPVQGNVRHNITIAEKNSGLTTHLNSSGPAVTESAFSELLTELSNNIKSGDTLCLSGSVPRGIFQDAYEKMLNHFSHLQLETVLDSRGHALRLGLRARPMIIKPNIAELEEYFSEPIRGVHHIALKGKRLIDMGIPYVFISLGSDGLIAIHENDCLLCTAPQVAVADTVGCGDALVAGILVARSKKFTFSETCRLAVAAGTSAAMHNGPGIVNRDDVWKLMEDVSITAI